MLPTLIGMAPHCRLTAHVSRYTKLPPTSSVLSVVRAAEDLGIRKVAVVNKWTDEMNRSLGAFFARGGVSVVGGATKSMHPHDFHQIEAGAHMQLAYELGRQAFPDHPDCAAADIGGGSC